MDKNTAEARAGKKKQVPRPRLDEILAPVRQEFEESGMSEEELDAFLNSVREQAHRDKQSKN